MGRAMKYSSRGRDWSAVRDAFASVAGVDPGDYLDRSEAFDPSGSEYILSRAIRGTLERYDEQESIAADSGVAAGTDDDSTD